MSRQCLSKWKARFDTLGEVGLLDRSSAPAHSPTQLAEPVVARIEQLRQDKKWSARLIADELASDGVEVSVDLGHFSRLRKVNAQAAMG